MSAAECAGDFAQVASAIPVAQKATNNCSSQLRAGLGMDAALKLMRDILARLVLLNYDAILFRKIVMANSRNLP